jgi:GH24 family phage-related lysozyme (muramidase)
MHASGSFDYKVIHPLIRNILDNRSDLNNTIQMAMPFVKATTTIQIPQLNGGIGFTLGLHAIDQDVKYEDIYSDQGSDMPLLGYTYVDGKTKRIYAFNKEEEIASRVFDRRASVFNNVNNFIRIPPPGITSVTIGRNKNGLLAHGQITISIPSLVQLESLHKTFLIPGVGMILEWGQQFAVESLRTNVTGELPDISYSMFPWYNKDETLRLLRRLGQNEIGLQEILNKYVYPSSGQYMWMFGRVANFNVTSLSDGSYQAILKIVGPSEDSWAYDTVNTVVPRKDPSTKFFCASETNSVASYFSQTNSGINLKSLLDSPPAEWKDHVLKFEKGNKKSEPTPDDKNNNTSEISFGNLDDAYFMTWRFFVNVVLNDPVRGVKRIFASALDSQTLNKIGMLLAYGDGPQRKGNVATLTTIDDPMEPYVGYNKYLRSVDPSVMIIVNEEAAKLAEQNSQYNATSVSQKFLTPNADSDKFKKAGTFNGIGPDRGFLSTGVWLNHKTVVECMLGGDTILRGITNLLDRMNRATLKYWDLAIDISEPSENMPHSYNYMVIDTNLRENSQNAVNKFIDNVHAFNKYVRVDNQTGKLVGSELIECNIDLSLPKRLFSQIATLGLVSSDDLKKVGAADDEASKTVKISDPNDTLARMFAITVLSPKSDTDQGPDLTILPRSERTATMVANGICGQANVQTPAQTGGNSNRAGNISVEESYKNKSAEDIQRENENSQKFLDSEPCKLCKECDPSFSSQSPEFMSFPPDANLNQAAASLLAREEGLPRGGRAYYDPPSQQTLVSIGYGHQIKEDEYRQGYIQAGDERVPLVGTRGIDTVLTSAQARKLLEIDVVKYVNRARAPLGDAWNKLTINQKVALTSYAYNTGSTRSLVTAGILNTINQNDSAGTAQIIRDKGIRTANGQVLQVLVNRRAREAALFGQDPIGQGGVVSTNPTAPQNTGVCTDAQYTKISTANKKFTISVADGKETCNKCKRAQQIVKQTSTLVESNKIAQQLVEVAVRQFPELQKLFRYVEIFPEYMVAEIADSADGNFANAFGASPGSLSISGDLVMPGINGFRVGELFWIDRIPTFYKIFGAFQIMSIEDNIDVGGWKTKINARFNYLGMKWKAAMTEKIKTETA